MTNEHLPEQANLKILKEIAELLNEETDLDAILTGVLNKLLQVTGVQTGWIFLLDVENGHRLAAYQNIPPALAYKQCSPLREGSCWCVDGIRDGNLTKAANIIECRRIEKAIEQKKGATDGIAFHATIPLTSGEEVFGLLNVAAPEKKEFDPTELALLESIALQIGSAIKRVRLTKKEQEVALIEERNRLARDLHDSVNQLLFSLTLTARAGAEMTEDPGTKDTFRDIQGLAQEALMEMRALIWQLKPNGLEKGLVQAIKAYGEMLGLSVNVQLSGVLALPSKVEEIVWRISQEALNNTKKHSGEDEIFLSLDISGRTVRLAVRDKGCGFKHTKTRVIPTIGIEGMRKRAESVGGTFTLSSAPGQGTEIIAELPF